MMTADELLKAGVEVLGANPEKEFRRLMREWHPDLCKDKKAPQVVAHLLALRARALGKQEEFAAQLPNFVLKYSGDEILAPAPPDKFAKVRDRLQRPKRLPEVRTSTTFVRPPDSFPMTEVLRKHNGVLPVRHVAWMLSRLYEVVWEMSDVEQIIGGLYLESLMVLREDHGVIPLDLRFMTQVGSRMTTAPAALVPLVPKDRIARSTFDLRSANRVALQLLGDPTGTGNGLLLLASKDPSTLPPRFLAWLRKSPEAQPKQQYLRYRELLVEVFGPPKYYKLEV